MPCIVSDPVDDFGERAREVDVADVELDPVRVALERRGGGGRGERAGGEERIHASDEGMSFPGECGGD